MHTYKNQLKTYYHGTPVVWSSINPNESLCVSSFSELLKDARGSLLLLETLAGDQNLMIKVLLVAPELSP